MTGEASISVSALIAVVRPVRASAYVAVALLRDGAATAWLLGVVKDGAEAHARDAVKALAHFRHDPRIREPALAAADVGIAMAGVDAAGHTLGTDAAMQAAGGAGGTVVVKVYLDGREISARVEKGLERGEIAPTRGRLKVRA